MPKRNVLVCPKDMGSMQGAWSCLMLARFEQQLFRFSDIALAHMRDANHALASPRCFRVAHRLARAVPSNSGRTSHTKSIWSLSQGYSDFTRRADPWGICSQRSAFENREGAPLESTFPTDGVLVVHPVAFRSKFMPDEEREIRRGPCPGCNDSTLKKRKDCTQGLELLHQSRFAFPDRF